MEERPYSHRIAAAAGDPAKLTEIIQELEANGTSVARRFLIEAIAKRREATARGAKAAMVTPPMRSTGWLAELNIETIDGRPLYRYGVTDESIRALRKRLCERRAAFTASPSLALAGQFVFWAADWFRSHYDGTGLTWDALGDELGVRCEWRHWQKLTDDGLRFWRLPPLRINGRHHRLAAIARQGGFPVAALDRTQGGWAQRYLENLVATLAGSAAPDFETANTIAGRLIVTVPATWQNSGMQIVSAELAMEVVRLRRLAEEKGGLTGALVSPWLDQHEPGWRDQLPFSISSAAGRTLIDGLMRTVALRGGHEAVKCYRWLDVGPDGRQEGISLELAGRLEGKASLGNLASEWSRLRLYPAGALAQHVAGELAVADPSEDGTWRARPSTQRTEFHLPANVPIDVELRGEGRRVSGPFVLPGGEAVTGELRVYTIDNETDAGVRLRLLASASGAFREDLLVVDIPTNWSVQSHGEASTCEPFPAGGAFSRATFEVRGSAIVTNARGDRYLLRAGQNAASRDRLVVPASNASFELADTTVRLIIGQPQAHVEERGRPRRAGNDELFWRPAGTDIWRPNVAAASAGRCEIAWRDRATGHIRARCDVVVLPASFTVRHAIVGNFQEVSIEGWPGRVSATEGLPNGINTWRLPLQGNTCSRFVATLQPDGGDPIDIVVPLRHLAWIESWSHGPTRREARLSLSVINRYVARSPQRCELMADLLDENGRPVPQGHARWWIDGELPLSTIRDDLAALLRPSGSLRSSIRLDFNDGNNDYWYVHEFEHELLDEGGGLVPSPAVAEEGVRIAYRALNNPVHERDAGGYGLLSNTGHLPILPPGQASDAVVYLRVDDRVLSAPRLLRGIGSAEPQDPLARAMLIADRSERQSALELLFNQIQCRPTEEGSRALVRRLIELVLSLDGLPPATFDALALLPSCPAVATTLLFQARGTELESLLRLEEGLPFAWWLIPKVHWDAAARAQAEFLFARLPDEPALVASTISETRAELCSLEPILAPLLDLSIRTDTLENAANAFLNRSGDRIDISNANPFRTGHDTVLPAWRYNEQFWRALDAPIAAALAAHRELELDDAEIRAAKEIAREHPQWFQEGFAASYREH